MTSLSQPSSLQLAIANATEQMVLEKCRYFTSVQLWPLRQRLDPQMWLSNFTASERPHAVALLNSVIYLSATVIDQMFVAAFHSLSRATVIPGDDFPHAQQRWRRFLESAIVTHVTGEWPHPTDSGHLFVRKARDLIGIPESQIMSAPDVLQRLLSHPDTPVIFVDDFVGSGQQFIATWEREYSLQNGTKSSFRELSRQYSSSRIFYIPLICTQHGKSRIAQAAPSAKLRPVHTIDERYSVFSSDSAIWSDKLRPTADEFLRLASLRAGLSDQVGAPNYYRGFASLGLTIAFEQGVPDATLPLLTLQSTSWKPLFRRAS